MIKNLKNPQPANKPWWVICKDGRHFFATQSQVIKFVAKRKGKIGCIMYEGKLIPTELKMYYAGLKLAGLLACFALYIAIPIVVH